MVAAVDRWRKCVIVPLGSRLGTFTLRRSATTVHVLSRGDMHSSSMSINLPKRNWHTFISRSDSPIMPNGLSRSIDVNVVLSLFIC